MRVKIVARFSVEVNLDEKGKDYDEQVRSLLEMVSDRIHGLELPGGDSEATFSTVDVSIVTPPPRPCRQCRSPVGADLYRANLSDAVLPGAHLTGADLYRANLSDAVLYGAMGYDTSSPEPCGHHCPSDCPRCGQEER